MKATSYLILSKVLSVTLALTTFTSVIITAFGQYVPDFTRPYSGVKPTFGTRPLLVILLGPDDPNPGYMRSREEIRNMIFGSERSIRGYFLENSYGQFTFREALTTPSLTAQDDPSTRDWDESSYYFMHNYEIHKKSAWVIQQVERMTSFRFRDYDVNMDGKVTADELCVLWVYPGGGDARGRGTNPSVVPVPSLSRGVELGLLVRGGAGMSMATIAHELGHQALKLGDLYAAGNYRGVSQYSLMCDQAEGSHLDPWAKIKLGWIRPTVITQDGWYTLNNVERYAEAYILYNPNHGTREYFIVENRWPGTSYEKKLPDQGLAIWYIDESYENQSDWARKTISLVWAGGTPPIGHPGNALWDGSDSRTGYDLTPTSSPSNTRWNNGWSSQIAILSIPRSGPQVTVFFDVPSLR